ncbi:MAG: hypothetical protein Q9219_005010 [cf. Caloplaca sp. 3 TL-2023]
MTLSKLSAFLLSINLISQASSTPVANSPEEFAARGLSTCQVVSDIVKVLHNPSLSASATKFCSSFISIPLRTATSVSTAVTTPAPVTTTLTETAVTTTIVTTTLGMPLTTSPPPAKEKRGGTLPPYLAAFASSKVSAACSCLSITPATTTIKNTATVTAPASTATATTTTTSTSTSTSTVLGVASQCLPAAISASPVSLYNPGSVAIAGTAQENFDNQQYNYPPVLDNPSSTNTCRIYRDVFNNCAADVAVFDTRQPPLAGEVNNFGIGPCTPDLS